VLTAWFRHRWPGHVLSGASSTMNGQNLSECAPRQGRAEFPERCAVEGQVVTIHGEGGVGLAAELWLDPSGRGGHEMQHDGRHVSRFACPSVGRLHRSGEFVGCEVVAAADLERPASSSARTTQARAARQRASPEIVPSSYLAMRRRRTVKQGRRRQCERRRSGWRCHRGPRFGARCRVARWSRARPTLQSRRRRRPPSMRSDRVRRRLRRRRRRRRRGGQHGP
jgi:hypothetical protein